MKKHTAAIITIILTVIIVTSSHLFLSPDSNQIIWGINQVRSQSPGIDIPYFSFLNFDPRPTWIKILECIWAVVTGYAIVCSSLKYSKLRLLAIMSSAILTTLLIAVIFWISFNALIDVGWVAFVVLAILVKRTYSYYKEKTAKKKAIIDRWKNYLSGNLLDKLVQNPSSAVSIPANVQIVVLSCKVYNIKNIFDMFIDDVTAMSLVFKNWQQEIYQIALKHHGTIIPTSNDEIKIIWNYPISQINACNLACSTAVDINDMCKKYPLIEFYMGISDGDALIYEGARPERNIYLGDVFHQSLLLTMSSQEYKVNICISESIQKASDSSFVCVRLTNNVYALLFHYRMDQPAHITVAYSQHEKLLKAYEEGRPKMALIIAKSLKTAWNGALKNYYEKVIADCEQTQQ